MSKAVRTQLIILTWLAVLLRLPALFANHFHTDEALFASWARLIAVWRDPLLLTQGVDKPPLLFYLQALFYPQYGPVEWAARMPDWIASLLLIPSVGVLAWRLFEDEITAVVSALFITLNPLTIQFSATAFTDPLLTTLIILAFFFIVDAHFTSAGLFFGLAAATKYQAWLFFPLLFVFFLRGFLVDRSGARGGPFAVWGTLNYLQQRNLPGFGSFSAIGDWLRGFVPVMILLLLWTLARWGSPGLWDTQMRNFGGLQFVEAHKLWPYFLDWLALFRLSLGGWAGTILLGLSLILLLVQRNNFFNELLLILFIFGYFLLHWLLGIPLWSRYLLPIMPLLALLFGRGLAGGWHLLRMNSAASWRKPVETGLWIAVLMIMVVVLGPTAWQARNGRFPLGGQPNADHGAHQVAAYLLDAPYGTVLYDHWYSWIWRYHFFDKGVYVSWFPNSADLVENLQVFGDKEGVRYIALPDTAVANPIRRAVTQAGFQLRIVLRTDTTPGMILYRIEKDQS